jgi:hypothetical protein
MTTFDQIQAAFPNGSMVGGEWVTLCPVHGDTGRKAPNLHIKVEGQKLLTFCNAGCPKDAVFNAVLARIKTPTANHKPETTSGADGWGYSLAKLVVAERLLESAKEFLTDRGITIETARRLRFGFENGYVVIPTFVDGELVAVKHRNTKPSSKEKKWKKFNRDKSTHWLFNRATFTDACFADDVYITESELDAAMLESMGIRAVSVDTAGHKISDADVSLLKNFLGTLVFAPDTDKPGIGCALKLAEDLGLEAAIGLKPPTKDLGDLHKKDPATFADNLMALRNGAIPLWQFGFRSVAQLEPGEIRMLIKGVSPEGNNMLGAASGVGKTWFQLSQAKAICTKQPFMGVFEVPERLNVLYLIPEAGDRGFRIRCEKMGIPTDGSVFRCRTMRDGILRLDDPMLAAAIKDWKPVIFLDTAIRFAGFKDENSSAENAGGLANLIFEMLKLGSPAVFSAHHSPKSTAEPDEKKQKLKEMTLENMLRGTGDIGAMCDCVWGLQPDDGGKEAAKEYLDESRNLTRLFVKCIKPRDFEPVDTFRIQGKPYIDEIGNFVVLTDQESSLEDTGRRAAHLIKAEPKISLTALAKKLGVSRNRLAKEIQIPGWAWKETSRTTGLWVPKSENENDTPFTETQ